MGGRVEDRRQSIGGYSGGSGHVGGERRQSEGYGRERPVSSSGDGSSRGYGERHSSGGYGREVPSGGYGREAPSGAYGRESTSGAHGEQRRPGGSGSSAPAKEAPATSYAEYKARKAAEK